MIPAKLRRLCGMEPESEVVVTEDNGRLTVETRRKAVERVQQWARTLPGANRSIVDELIAERRQEAERDRGD